MSELYIDATKSRDTWYETADSPKLVVNRECVRFNKPAMEQYELDQYSQAAIYISDDGYKLGVKPTNVGIDGAYMYSFKSNAITCLAALKELNVKLNYHSIQYDFDWNQSNDMAVLNFAKAIRKLSQNAP